MTVKIARFLFLVTPCNLNIASHHKWEISKLVPFQPTYPRLPDSFLAKASTLKQLRPGRLASVLVVRVLPPVEAPDCTGYDRTGLRSLRF